MRITLSPINSTISRYNKNKTSNALTSHPMNVSAKDTFTPSFKGDYGSPLVDFLWERKWNLKGDLKEISGLINPKTINKIDKEGNSPLYLASWFEAPTAIISHLIKKGAIVNLRNKNGVSPLGIAAFNGSKRIVERLLNAGANINHIDNSGNTPLMQAISMGTSEVSKLLVDKGADIKIADNDGRLPIHLASDKYLGGYTDKGMLKNVKEEKSLLKFIKTLLNKGSDINAKDNKYGATPLLLATRNSINVMKFLINNGADVAIKDKQGNTALHYAAISDGPKAEVIKKIQILLDNGVDINAKNKSGKTALYRACKSGYPEVKSFLIEKGANPSQIATKFPVLGDNANKDYPEKVAQEAKDAALDKLPDFVKSDRRWYYWDVSLPKGMVLPREKAIKLNKTMGGDVRAFGYAGGMDEEKLNAWMDRANGGVDQWHVDTKEGLAKLVKAILSI